MTICNNELIEKLKIMFPNAGCELTYHGPFDFLISVLLSSQTTDKKVNTITPILFSKYKTIDDLKAAKYEDVYNIIKPLGLAKNKAKYILDLAKIISEKYSGIMPSSLEELEKLPGVGHKTASVYMAQIHSEPNLAVDTHVFRVSKRLGITDEKDDVKKTEEKLKAFFNIEDWIKAHHLLLFLGRYVCKSPKPNCKECLLSDKCKKYGVNL